MNWDAMGAIGEVLSAIAVLVTLVYLGIQIRQNTEAMKVAAMGTLHDLHVVTEKNEPYITSLLKLQRNEQLTQEEKIIAVERFYTIVRAFERLWLQLQMGAVAQEQFDLQIDLLRWAMALPQPRRMWAAIAPDFSPGFREVVENEVLSPDAPASRMSRAMEALDPEQQNRG